MKRTRRLADVGLAGAAVATAVAILAASPRASATQTPTFRSSVDLIAVHVQVVDDSGTPVEALRPEDFSVSISGDRRRVVSADYVRSTTVDGRPLEPSPASGPVATNLWPSDPPAEGRTYVLAFDVSSLTVADSRAVVGSALTFIDRLLRTDRVGLYTFPIGSSVEPTLDHAAVKRAVSEVVGSPQAYFTNYHLSLSEIVDINAESARLSTLRMGAQQGPIEISSLETSTLRAVERRECLGFELGCAANIQSEAKSLGFYLEGQATVSLNGLRDLISSLGEYPGRKTLVMFSGGIAASDRPGGRPNLGNLPAALGQEAAATNTTIYTVHVDTAEMRAMAAESRRPTGTPSTRARDFAVGSRVLEQFSGASGGALMRVVTGSGEYALGRVLRETSSHYLLGVEPDNSDRDGKLRPLKIQVNVDDVTVRGRSWVVVPRRE